MHVSKLLKNAAWLTVDFVLYQHAKRNKSIIDRCQGPDDFISKIILFCFVLRARDISGEELHNKIAAIFSSSFQMGTLKLGRMYASRLQTWRLGEDNYSSMIQQFLYTPCVSCALVTNQITHCINGPIESAVAHLGVYSRLIWSACGIASQG